MTPEQSLSRARALGLLRAAMDDLYRSVECELTGQ